MFSHCMPLLVLFVGPRKPVTFGSLGMVLMVWLEAAIRSQVIGQEVRLGAVLSGRSETHMS